MRPLNDWILVRLEPLPTQVGLLHVVDNSQHVRKGTVVRVGPGKESESGVRAVIDLSPGDRVAFLRWHTEHQQGKAIKKSLAELGDDHALLKPEDILLVLEEGDPHIQT